jgi:hypothetical protein
VITLAGIRPLALTCMPCARAHERMASDWPGGAVLAVGCCPDAPGRPFAGGALRAADSLPDAVFVADLEAGDSLTTALVADFVSETDLLLPFAERLLRPSCFPPRPAADRLVGFVAAPRRGGSTCTLGLTIPPS